MRYCNMCNGELHEIDDIGTEECQKCGTIFKLVPMEKSEDGTND